MSKILGSKKPEKNKLAENLKFVAKIFWIF